MLERLLIPAWNAPARTLDDWRDRLESLGMAPTLDRSDPEEPWLIVEAVGMRLLAVVEGPALTALHAEIDAPDPAPALAALDEAAGGLNWEVHDEDGDDEDDAP